MTTLTLAKAEVLEWSIFPPSEKRCIIGYLALDCLFFEVLAVYTPSRSVSTNPRPICVPGQGSVAVLGPRAQDTSQICGLRGNWVVNPVESAIDILQYSLESS